MLLFSVLAVLSAFGAWFLISERQQPKNLNGARE